MLLHEGLFLMSGFKEIPRHNPISLGDIYNG